jgi:hypothetical protein
VLDLRDLFTGRTSPGLAPPVAGGKAHSLGSHLNLDTKFARYHMMTSFPYRNTGILQAADPLLAKAKVPSWVVCQSLAKTRYKPVLMQNLLISMKALNLLAPLFSFAHLP